MTRLLALAVAAIAATLVPAAPAAAAPPCPEPELLTGPDGDNTRDAAGRGQLFERITAPPVTEVEREGGGVALVDLNRDGQLDVLTQYDDQRWPTLHLGEGCFRFREHPLEFGGPPPPASVSNASTPTLADFDGDGLLDMFVTRRGRTGWSSLYLARGSFDTFEEVGPAMGVTNAGAYSTQASFGDVNGDGYLDIAVGADQIGNKVSFGRPMQRLYVYRPPAAGGAFEDGRFEDVSESGTGLVPGFGGSDLNRCDPAVDRAGPAITLRDLDDDGDLDLAQAYHNDMNGGSWDDPCATGQWRSGVAVWRNTLRETGAFGFEPVPRGAGGDFADADESLPEQGLARYDSVKQVYEPVTAGVSLPYLNTADTDNDGDLDVTVVGPTDPEWHVNTAMIAGKHWRNEGSWRFPAATDDAGLGALSWTYGRWADFWDATAIPFSGIGALGCFVISNQRTRCATMTGYDHQFYAADTVFADFNNDGWLDMLYMDRHEVETAWDVLRNVLFMNRGDGTFEPVTTEVSGIDTNSVAAEAGDLNGDGLLDIYLLAAPGNSYPVIRNVPGAIPKDRTLAKVYWNTGAAGAAANHWLKVRLSGRPERELIGAKVLLRDPASGAVLARRDYFPSDSYKSSHSPEVHFGLGARTSARVEVELPDGTRRSVDVGEVDMTVTVDAG